MRSSRMTAIITAAVFFLSVSVSAQTDAVRCGSAPGKFKFKLLTSWKTITGDKTKVLHVLVKPSDINSERLRRLAARLDNEYCREQRLLVVIFDSREQHQNYLRLEYFSDLRKRFVAERGYYSFDRSKEEKPLEFSKTAGNPTTEVQIDLALDKSATTVK